MGLMRVCRIFVLSDCIGCFSSDRSLSRVLCWSCFLCDVVVHHVRFVWWPEWLCGVRVDQGFGR